MLPLRYEIADAFSVVGDVESLLSLLPGFECDESGSLCAGKEGEFVYSTKQGDLHRVDVWGESVEWFEKEEVLRILPEEEDSAVLVEEHLRCCEAMNAEWSACVLVG